MWSRIRGFFDRLFRIGKAVSDVSDAAQSIQDIGKGGGASKVFGAVAKAANNTGEATDSIQDAVKK
jgi:hypothetical protein